MSDLVQNLPLFMLIAIVIIIGVSQWNRLAGGLLGVAFWSAAAGLGALTYDQGSGFEIAFFNIRLSRMAFLAICGAFILVNLATVYADIQKKRRLALRKQILSDEEPSL